MGWNQIYELSKGGELLIIKKVEASKCTQQQLQLLRDQIVQNNRFIADFVCSIKTKQFIYAVFEYDKPVEFPLSKPKYINLMIRQIVEAMVLLE